MKWRSRNKQVTLKTDKKTKKQFHHGLCVSSGVNTMEKKLAEYKCDTNEAVCLKLGMFYCCFILYVLNMIVGLCAVTMFWGISS